MGLMGFLKQAEEKAHAILDKVPNAGISVRAFNPDGTLAPENVGQGRNPYTLKKAQEWAAHMNRLQQYTNRPEVVWKVVEGAEEPEIVQGEYVASGEVRDSARAYDGEIVED